MIPVTYAKLRAELTRELHASAQVACAVFSRDHLVLVDRSGGTGVLASPTTGRRYNLSALWVLDLPTYEPGGITCPRCASGEPVHAPGSTGTGT